MSSISAAFKNALLDGAAPAKVSIHDGFPGVTGANEIAGTTRQTCVFGAAAGGLRTLTATVTFTAVTGTVRWVSLFDSSDAFLITFPNGGAVPKNFMAVPSSDLIYAASHGFSDADPVVFFQGTPPGGLTEGTIYYVRDSGADSFKVAATVGGAAIDLTAAPSFGCVVSAITEVAHSSGTHVFSSGSIVIPD